MLLGKRLVESVITRKCRKKNGEEKNLNKKIRGEISEQTECQSMIEKHDGCVGVCVV